MCIYCDRRKDIKIGWKQYPLYSKDEFKDELEKGKFEIHSNLNIQGLPDWEARIYNYQTAIPELIITSKNIANALWGNGTATIYIPIKYCPNCGRKLGR